MSTGKIVPIRNMDKLSNARKEIEKNNSYWISKISAYLSSFKGLKATSGIA
jgi:hypothetical protein